LIIQIMFGAMIYVTGSAICKLDSFQYLFNLIKSGVKREGLQR
jgi:hypothetical protein